MVNVPLPPSAGEPPGDRSELIPLLQETQAALGWLPPDSLRSIARRLRLTPHEVFGVASFFAQFRFEPPGRHAVKVCLGTACHVRGGERILDALSNRLGIAPGGTTPDREYQLSRVACLGCCALAPVVTVDDKVHAEMSVAKVREVLDASAR